MTAAAAFTETLGHYNVLFKNSARVIRGDVTELTKRASAFDLNEGVDHDAIEEALRKAGFEWVRTPRSDWICWDPAVWKRRPWHRVWKLSPGAQGMGLDFKNNPPRHMVAQCLEHIASRTVHDFYATHLTAGYASAKRFPTKLAQYKDIAAKQEVHRVDVITEACIRRREHVDFDHLIGDMNSRQSNREEPWYPANVWRDTWVPDTEPGSIDWMLHSRRAKRNGLVVVKRWTEGAAKGWDSDHRASFERVEFPAT